MKADCILIRYGELALKGKNQNVFVQQLMRTIRNKIKQFEGVQLTRQQGRLFIELNGQASRPVLDELKTVFGIVGFSPAMRVANEIASIERGLIGFVAHHSFSSFKIVAKRANKRFPIGSQELNQRLGTLVLSSIAGSKVDVHDPQLRIHIEVREKETYIYGNDIKGLGGLPVGVSGKVMLFLSGGIDSPVAGYLAAKRGTSIDCIHFHSYPYTSQRARQKVIDLAQILTQYTGPIRLFLIPFTEVQLEIKKECPESYLVTIMRRMMLRIAEEVANEKTLAFITGENLGQVASQTLESMSTISAVAKKLILRPLLSMDKQEIITIAKQINTYETSILPYEDCCTIFLPKNPKTKPAEKDVIEKEKKLDIETLVRQAVENMEVLKLNEQHKEESGFF